MNTQPFTDRVLNVPDAGIGSIMYYARQYKNTISLGQGAPNFPTPSCVYDEIHQLSKTDPNLGMYNTVNDAYHLKLKSLLQKEFEKDYGFSPHPEDFYLTIGGIGGLFATLMAITQKGDEVIFMDPSYPLHLSQLALTQATPVYVPYKETNNWRPDMELLRSKVTKKTKAIILTNPNNPTGTILNKEELKELSDIVIKNNIFLILDEAYSYLTFETPFISPMTIPELRAHIILSKSFSKEYAMTGWRIGYLWVQQPLREKIHNVHLYFSINPSTISIVGATVALSHPDALRAKKEYIQKISESRKVIIGRMSKLTDLFQFSKPDGAFYLFPRIKTEMDAVSFAKMLIDKTGVITIPGDSMGPQGKNHLRVSFCAPSTLIDRAFDRIEEWKNGNLRSF
jgi:aspartate/methionine/tyrosine aminotransferase